MTSIKSATDLEKATRTSSLTVTRQTSLRSLGSKIDIIDWAGPDDPEIPLNWSSTKKWKNILMVSTLTLLTPFASSMFAPSIPQIMTEFDITNELLGSFMVSIYLLGYAFGPLFLAPCSELYGRLPVYHACTFLFMLGNLACGLSHSMAMLIVFRFMTGLFGAGPLTIGSGTVADCFRQEERGKAMSVFLGPILIGPSIGPACGAYLSRSLGWRWNSWFLIILTGVVFTISLIFQNETYAPVIYNKRVKKMCKEAGTPNLRLALESNSAPKDLFILSIIRPTKMLFLSPIVFGISLLTAVAYGILYLLFTTLSEVFSSRYGIVTNVGLTYLGGGVGQAIGLVTFGAVSDSIVRKMTKKNGGEMKPEYRLPPIVPGGAMIPVGLLIYGWSAEYRVHWFLTLFGTVLIGVGVICVFTPAGIYLVDAFPVYAASATAANTVLRSIGGALLPLGGPKMYETLGQGWGNTLLAGISLATMGMILIAMKYGERIRTHPKCQLKL